LAGATAQPLSRTSPPRPSGRLTRWGFPRREGGDFLLSDLAIERDVGTPLTFGSETFLDEPANASARRRSVTRNTFPSTGWYYSMQNDTLAPEHDWGWLPEPPGPSPEAALATMDKALAENDLVKLKNKRTRRTITRRK
jgi:hypothetical protein